ncbi:regucalcin-like [Belonocnema kinseyi]|uniref:regucalcin-like n=1 Tax=Belonocnema kinseyi TaxID=2817044 RepID=UPI00143D2345|nr:regucalcin-like [Belonocnema kinseyi]
MHVSTGIAWDPHEDNKLYYIDARAQKILLFAYDESTRKVTGSANVVFDLNVWHQSLPQPLYSGHATLGRMTIDRRARLWVPLNGGSHVLEIDPRGINKVLGFIQLKAAKLNACVFGGVPENILYVSSMPYAPNEASPANDEGGKIFAVSNLGVDVIGYRSCNFDWPNPPPKEPTPRSRYRW